MRKIYNLLRIKVFDYFIEKQREKAEKLYIKKQDTVSCVYCGQLLKKQEAGCTYDFKTKELEFFHEECFNKYEHTGTLEELEKMY